MKVILIGSICFYLYDSRDILTLLDTVDQIRKDHQKKITQINLKPIQKQLQADLQKLQGEEDQESQIEELKQPNFQLEEGELKKLEFEKKEALCPLAFQLEEFSQRSDQQYACILQLQQQVARIRQQAEEKAYELEREKSERDRIIDI